MITWKDMNELGFELIKSETPELGKINQTWKRGKLIVTKKFVAFQNIGVFHEGEKLTIARLFEFMNKK